MKKILFCCLMMGLSLLAGAQEKIIVISNPLSIVRSGQIIEIPWNQVRKAYPVLDTSSFRVTDVSTMQELPYQLEYKGMNDVQNLLVQLDVPAKGATSLRLVNAEHKIFQARTYCRYIRERKDDFAWENDKIAFRVYGKGLEAYPNEMANGVDVWVKRTDRLILDERYKLGEYHIDHGDGLDYYHVGLTLGAGGIAPYIHDTIWFPKNYRHWKILDNGPLRSSFQLNYDEWTASGRKIKAVKTVSIDAGSQFSRTEITYITGGNQPLPLAVGILKREEAGSMLLDEKAGLLAYWEPQHGADGTTGVACVFSIPVLRMSIKHQHLLAETGKVSQPFIYYHGAAWDKAGDIKTAKDWFQYVQRFQINLENPLSVSFR